MLNATNARMLAEVAGSEDVEDWKGTRVLLCQSKVKFQGVDTPCIRLDYPDEGVTSAAAAATETEIAFDTSEL